MAEISQELTELLTVLKTGLLGEVEFRTGLEHLPGWEWFKENRDTDIDDHIRELGEIENDIAKARGDGEEIGSDEPLPE